MLADDDVLLREGLAGLLRRSGFEVVGQVGTASALIADVRALRPDLAIVDVFLGQESGFRIARDLVARGRDVILISTHDEVELDDLIAASPALGFLSKSELSAEAILRILDGRATARRER